MTIRLVFAAMAALMPLQAAHALPVNAMSELDLFHRVTMNGGALPIGIDQRLVGGTLILDATWGSGLDDPMALDSETDFTQIGSLFAMPPVPYLAQRTVRTERPNLQFAEASYDISIEAVGDINGIPGPSFIVDRTVDNSGAAELESDVPGFARSEFINERTLSFENTTNDTISFTIVGEMDVSLAAQVDAADTEALAEAAVYTIFDEIVDTTFNFIPTGVYAPSRTESGTDATVEDSYGGDDGAFTGVSLSASALADGMGGDVEAGFAANPRYLFLVNMAQGASFEMRIGFSQLTRVAFRSDGATTVPVAPSFLFLAMGLATAGFARRHTRSGITA